MKCNKLQLHCIIVFKFIRISAQVHYIIVLELILTCFHASFFHFLLLLLAAPLPALSRHLSPRFPPRKMLCSVEQRTQRRASRGAVPGWTFRPSSGRKFLPRNLREKRQNYVVLKTLRAKGTLISEPRFSTPCEMRFFPRVKGKTAFFKEKTVDKGHFPFLAWEKSHVAGGRKSGLTN